MRNSFSQRNYTNSLEEKVSLKDTRHRMVSPLICASSTRITCEMHLNQFKSLEEFILYLGQGMIVYTEIWKKSRRDSKAPKIMSPRNKLRADQKQLIRMQKLESALLG